MRRIIIGIFCLLVFACMPVMAIGASFYRIASEAMWIYRMASAYFASIHFVTPLIYPSPNPSCSSFSVYSAERTRHKVR